MLNKFYLWRALEEAICYRALLLGITKTSLNIQSFISKASFEDVVIQSHFKILKIYLNQNHPFCYLFIYVNNMNNKRHMMRMRK